MDVFKIKKNDTNPALAVTLQYSDGTAIDLTNGSVWFVMGNKDYTPYVSGLSVITGSTLGMVEYRWTGSPDTQVPGTYWGEFEMNWSGSKMTLPSDHSLQIQVFEDYN